MTLLVLIPTVPSLLYIILSISPVQQAVGRRAEKELTALLGTDVTIGNVEIAPFNRVTLGNISVKDPDGVDALTVGHLGAGINLTDLIFSGRIVVSYAEIIDLKAKIYRDSANTPLNIAPILERFKPKDPNRPPTLFDLAVNMVVIRRAGIEYDILSSPAKETNRFDPAHIHVNDLRADIKLPRIKNDDFIIEVKRLAAKENSGITLKELRGNFTLSDTAATVTGLIVDLPATHLAIGDISASYSSLKTITGDIIDSPVSLLVLPGSYATPMDFSAFAPELADVDARADIEIDLSGTVNDLTLDRLDITAYSENVWIRGNGKITGLAKGADNLHIDINRLNISAGADDINAIAGFFTTLPAATKTLIAGTGHVNLLGDLTASRREIGFNGSIITDPGNVDIDMVAVLPREHFPLQLQGTIETEEFNTASLFPALNNKMGSAGFYSEFDLSLGKNADIRGHLQAIIDHVEWNGYRYETIEGNIDFYDRKAEGIIASDNAALDFTLRGEASLSKTAPHTEFYADVRNVDFAPFFPTGPLKDLSLSLTADANIDGRNPDTATGWVTVDDIKFHNGYDHSLSLDNITLEARMVETTRIITMNSDIIDGRIRGRYPVAQIVPTAKEILSEVYPALINSTSQRKLLARKENLSPEEKKDDPNLVDFDFNFLLKADTVIAPFFNLPVKLVDNVTVAGAMESEASAISFSIDAPYLLQKNKLIENSILRLEVDGQRNSSNLYASTVMPTKNGPMTLTLRSTGRDNEADTDINWHIARENAFHGNFNFATLFERDSVSRNLSATINVNPSTMVFNDTTWTVNRSRIDINPKSVVVNNFNIGREGQYLDIDGVASADSTDVLKLRLRDINLDYIFETLNISSAMFGGRATGEFFASSLFSGAPIMYTPALDVESLSYNHCVMGDTRIVSAWDNEKKAVTIDADIDSGQGHRSSIKGFIAPATEELDFAFDADHAPAGFMQPFMEAFADEVSGTVSGKAHLYGTFKYIDMTGDIYADNLKLKIGFTNTAYTVSDSVHIRPGIIQFHDVVLKDVKGHTALLSGELTHTFFKEPRFRFDITDTRDFLCYDVKKNDLDPWYGTIYGNNGIASITGAPGWVNISVTMDTAPHSAFTFIISDTQSATEYDFITFRDRDRQKKDSIAALDTTPMLVKQFRNNPTNSQSGEPTLYSMDFNIGVEPNATMTIIMDPIAGDSIRATGSGKMNMKYSNDGDLDIRGTYTINKGSYNFTLQDIFLKNFTLKEGSSITFKGDPYSAELDITAINSVKANLSDLDESFLQDKELNTTSVNVDALLYAKGDMRHPDISYDINIPSSPEVNRKVHSIISTEDMMSRQIIYLLALNRFYTPDYMTATRGNELVSVASSTISSQLSSMLGQLSDKWSIAPQFRSDRGDFSDLEVDVTLSSHLLNNRLLLNGNLGYRDKSLNNNSFIGDFDVEYLLNRSGSIRLKAYNRYNDQNYYLRSALTTQGIGVVFKREFDNIFSFLNPFRRYLRLKKKKGSSGNDPAQETLSVPSDTVSAPQK